MFSISHHIAARHSPSPKPSHSYDDLRCFHMCSIAIHFPPCCRSAHSPSPQSPTITHQYPRFPLSHHYKKHAPAHHSQHSISNYHGIAPYKPSFPPFPAHIAVPISTIAHYIHHPQSYHSRHYAPLAPLPPVQKPPISPFSTIPTISTIPPLPASTSHHVITRHVPHHFLPFLSYHQYATHRYRYSPSCYPPCNTSTHRHHSLPTNTCHSLNSLPYPPLFPASPNISHHPTLPQHSSPLHHTSPLSPASRTLTPTTQSQPL